MNVLLIKSKTKLQYFVYIVSWKSTQRPTCNIDKTLKKKQKNLSFWIFSYTGWHYSENTWKKVINRI